MGITNRTVRNISRRKIRAIIMVTHDCQPAHNTERMLLLKDGKKVDEMQGLHLSKKNLTYPHCGSNIQIDDDKCSSIKKLFMQPMNFSDYT